MFKLREDQYKCLGFQLQEFSQKTEFMHYRQAFSLWASSWLSSKNLPAMRRRRKHGFDLWVGKIHWRRKWQPTLLFLPGKSHGQRSLVCYTPWDHKELDMCELAMHAHTHAHTHTHDQFASFPPLICHWLAVFHISLLH